MVWKVQRKFAGADVVGANVAGRRGQGFGFAPADDEQIFVDTAGLVNYDGCGSAGSRPRFSRRSMRP